METFTCECGYSGPVSKFCPECGRKVEEEYTCECGYRSKGANFCPNCGRAVGVKVQAVQSMPVPVAGVDVAPEPKPESEKQPGWKCPHCGAEDQAEERCSVCGAKIRKEIIFRIAMYMTTNPPRTDGATVYEYSDSELMLEMHGRRMRISTDIIEPAYESIRAARLDDPTVKDPYGMAMVGGMVNVCFKDGDNIVNASMYDKGSVVQSVYYELMGLFNEAAKKSQEE